MGRGTHNVYTCWTPLGDVAYELGPLALLVGSHRFERVRETYGRMDVDRDHVTGWFSNDPIDLVDTFRGQWRTAAVRARDPLIFGIFPLDASPNNTSEPLPLNPH